MSNYCQNCGTPVVGRFCVNCGAKTEPPMTQDEAKRVLSRAKRRVCPDCAYGGLGYIRDGCWVIARDQVLKRYERIAAGINTVQLHGVRIDTREVPEIAAEIAREAEALTKSCVSVIGFAYGG